MSSFESEPTLVPAPIYSVTPPPSQPYVLVGPLGMRAGWGILIFSLTAVLLGVVLFLGLAKGTGRLQQFQAQSRQARAASDRAKAAHTPPAAQPLTVSLSLLQESASVGAVLLAAFGVSFLERRRFGVYGLGSQHGRDLIPGAVCGFVAISILIGLLRGFHLLVFDRQLLHGAAILRFGLAWLSLFLLVGIFEEFLFRGYIQFTLMRGLLGLGRRLSPRHERLFAFWASAVLWSLLFFAVHIGNSGENPAGLAGVFLAGILFSYALWRTGSLWWGVGFHMMWDWSQSFLFGVPDSGTLSVGRLFATHSAGKVLLSGGVDGPEASLLMIPVLLGVFVILRLRPQAAQPPVAPEPFSASGHTIPPGAIA